MLFAFSISLNQNRGTLFNKAHAQEAMPTVFDRLQNINPEELKLSDEIKLAHQDYNRLRLHLGLQNKKTLLSLQILEQLIQRYSEINQEQKAPKWSTHRVQLPDGDELELDETWAVFTSQLMGEQKVDKEDLSIVFPWSHKNELQVLADKEVFWPSLIKDISEAKSSIHMQMFGFQDHEITKNIVALFKQKVTEGVKVRVLLDQWGARMKKIEGRRSQSIINEMRESGIEVLVTFDSKTKGYFHMDHRKIYVIDGKIGITTGYTMEDHMRNDHFDVGIRATGELVAQMQMNFLLSYMYFGGTLDSTRGVESLIASLFPEPLSLPVIDHRARVASNVPGVAHASTETYYNLLGGDSKAPLHIINPYLNDGVTMNLLLSAVRNGREVNVYTGEHVESPLYNFQMRRDFDILSAAGVHCFYYQGPDLKLRSHAKGILVEGEQASLGSTNLDSFSLFHNYEQNIVSDDVKFVEDIKENVFDYVRRYSKPYEPTKGFKSKLKLRLKSFPGALSRFILGNKNGQGYRK